MNESKAVIGKTEVAIYDVKIDGRHDFVVTHADYKALEERSEHFRKEWDKAEGEVTRLELELASLKARVAELVEADHAWDVSKAARLSTYGEKYLETLRAEEAAFERRRIALESLK